jgi:5-formyltetrahydrofolate cyclo-ligase
MRSKSQIRIEKKIARESLSKQRREEASKKACSFLINSSENSPVLSFASKPLEIDLWPFNQWLLKTGNLLLPRLEKGSLAIYHVKNLESLVLSEFNLLEPDPGKCEQVLLNPKYLVLVPGLAFDESKNRIGYGKGHFDKFLQSVSSIKWGIGFLEEKTPFIPKEKHDIPLDAVYLF